VFALLQSLLLLFQPYKFLQRTKKGGAMAPSAPCLATSLQLTVGSGNRSRKPPAGRQGAAVSSRFAARCQIAGNRQEERRHQTDCSRLCLTTKVICNQGCDLGLETCRRLVSVSSRKKWTTSRSRNKTSRSRSQTSREH
jgi:hypothetical protein